MGLFDGIGSALGNALQGKGFDVFSIANQVFQNAGGVNGIVAQMQAAGLGEHISSWIGTGANLPISAQQIETVLSSVQLQSFAQSFGVDVSQVSHLLADALPKAIDEATPNGQLPT